RRFRARFAKELGLAPAAAAPAAQASRGATRPADAVSAKPTPGAARLKQVTKAPAPVEKAASAKTPTPAKKPAHADRSTTGGR
ncbi:MAG: hypothetical protein M1457_04465, partial [bacterium]|nr:hypothetical protein [bacterium]